MGINATKVEKTKLKKQLFNCKIPYDWGIFVLKTDTTIKLTENIFCFELQGL